MPLVRPLTVIGDNTPVLVPDTPPLLDVQLAEKRRIGLPLSAPGVNATEIEALPRVTLVIVGGLGAPSASAGVAHRPINRPPVTNAVANRAVTKPARGCRTRPHPHPRRCMPPPPNQ